MTVIEGPVRFRTLLSPKDYPPLVDFCVGKERLEEHEVNRTVRRIYAGLTEMQQVPVILEKPDPKDCNGEPCLIGFCGVATGFLENVQGAGDRGGAYIPALGTDLTYRKTTLEDGKTRPGNALIEGALKTIEMMFGGPPMVYVFAKVKPTNKGSKQLLDEHGFEDMGNHGGETVLLRPPDVPPDFRRELTWSR